MGVMKIIVFILTAILFIVDQMDRIITYPSKIANIYKVLPHHGVRLGLVLLGLIIFLSIQFSNKLTVRHFRNLVGWGITWNYDNFLGMSGVSGRIARISSFQCRGYNNRREPITKVDGYIQSNITNEKVPILLDSMLPEETKGIPAKCNFLVTALFYDPKSNKQGLTEEEFIRKFSDFTFVFKFDNKQYKKHFSHKRVIGLLDDWRKEINPRPNPRVTKK